ncbi:MAG: sulfur relay DsrE/F-like protein [Devosia sp.]|jgi:predicted peroxiredoxin|nr:sulfur relay DsrE/F-like protein [Devosia sp.]
MAHFLFHITTGPENPSKAALAFLVAKTALEDGHEVSMFMASDAVALLRTQTVATLEGVGTGALADHVAAIKGSSAVVFYSGMSAKARNIGPDDLAIPTAQPAMPTKLVSLAAAADVVLSY